MPGLEALACWCRPTRWTFPFDQLGTWTAAIRGDAALSRFMQMGGTYDGKHVV
ncbi:hypothetical protein [Streptomyces microflavus]|uniref:hypothetical protein n=1 Tax=Streptomyces microflavus TaxID=1919 RepID=UPI0033DA336C